MALFVPLDASYAQDPKILDLDDERAELLFVRSLAYCKLHLTDGLVHRRALHQIAPCQDDVMPNVLADDLVRVGLWRESERGWVVCAWLAHNPSSEEILSPSRGRELAHQRHHVKKGVQKEGCPFCFPADPQVAAHDAVQVRCVDAVRDAEHAMPESEPQPEPEASTSIVSTTSVVADAPSLDDEQKIRATAAKVGRSVAATVGATNPDAYAAKVTAEILTGPDTTQRERIAAALTAGTDPDTIAATWQPTAPIARPAAPAADPEAVAKAREAAARREAETRKRLAEQAAVEVGDHRSGAALARAHLRPVPDEETA